MSLLYVCPYIPTTFIPYHAMYVATCPILPRNGIPPEQIFISQRLQLDNTPEKERIAKPLTPSPTTPVPYLIYPQTTAPYRSCNTRDQPSSPQTTHDIPKRGGRRTQQPKPPQIKPQIPEQRKEKDKKRNQPRSNPHIRLDTHNPLLMQNRMRLSNNLMNFVPGSL